MYYDENDYELLYLIAEENEEAKDMFYEKYRPMVEMKAKKYFSYIQNKGYDINDLIQEGMIGLSRAIADFENQKNVKFRTFANVCIERQLLSFVRDVNRQKHHALNSSLSIDASDKRTGRTLLEVLSNDSTPNPEDSFILFEEEEEMKNKMRKYLTKKEQEVFDLRLEGFSYQEIACLLNTTKKSVDGTISRIKQKLSGVKESK